MSKLWDKGYQLDRLAEEYEVGEDATLDNMLARADVLGSIAHAHALYQAGILTQDEFSRLKGTLVEALKLAEAGNLVLEEGDEDIHSRLERFLTDKLGPLGQKIHTGRSRNDQVLVDLRLFAREEILDVASRALELARGFVRFARTHETVPMPGYTHMQRAMISSVGLWASAFAESLVDDVRLLMAVYDLNDQSPLGSAAGYGVPLDIDRELTARLLGFSRVQRNTLYCQNSRGKIEASILHGLAQIMVDMSRFAQDLLLFTTAEFRFFRVSTELLTGSSLMPQKFNLDVMELLRARTHQIISCEQQVLHTIAALPSGYNRDVQETKGPLLRSFRQVGLSLMVCLKVLEGLEVDREGLREACTAELFATDAALDLVRQGIPFREAYRQVALRLKDLELPDVSLALAQRRHLGAPGNLALDKLEADIDLLSGQLASRRGAASTALEQLLKL